MAAAYNPQQMAAYQQYQLQAQQQQALQQQQSAQAGGNAALQAQLQVQQQLQQQAQLQQAQAQQQAQLQAQQQAAGQAQPAQGQAQGGEQVIGNERHIQVTGCTHATVGTIVRGTFQLFGENHGKPTWKKDAQVNGLDVMCYFWDQRDGAAFSGWWFGPKVGGDQVWAYHASQSQTPPVNNWKVPYDGPVDPTFIISKSAGQPQAQAYGAPAAAAYGAPAAAAGNPMAQLQMQQQQMALKQQQDAAMKQQQASTQQQQGLAQQQQAQMLQAQQAQQMKEQMARMQQQRQAAMQQQQEAHKKQLEDNKQKLEEANQKRQAEQQAQMETMKRQQAEQQASIAIRRIIQKVGGATLETFEAVKKELDEALQKGLETTGSQKEKVIQEVTSAVEKATARIEQVKETQRKMEETRKEMQKKKEEALEKVRVGLKEFEELIVAAEAASKSLKEECAPLNEDKDKTADDLVSLNKSVDEAGAEARLKGKACTDFVASKGNELKPQDLTGQGNELKQLLNKLMARVHDCTRSTEAQIQGAKASSKKAVKRAEARKVMDGAKALFDKYDSDKDGFLNRREVLKYAKAELDFKVPESSIETIWKYLVVENSKGVSKESFQKLKMFIGAAREKVLDGAKRTVREEKEKKLAAMKLEFKEKIDDAAKCVEEVFGVVKKAEEKATALHAKAKTESASDLVKMADEAEEAVKVAREELAKGKTVVSDVAEGADEALKGWVSAESKKLDAKLTGAEPRLARSTALATKCREDARKKDHEEIYKIEKAALAMLRFHQTKNKLSSAEMFALVDSGKDDKIDAGEFINFFKSCDKEEAKEPKEGEAAKAPEAPPSDEDLSRLFGSLDEDSAGSLSKDKFTSLVRIFMKVTKDTVITEDLSVKDSKPLRRLDVGEVVEIITGPTKEPTVDVLRVKAHVMKDDIEGWITMEGNQGSKFLVDGGELFKVVKETVLTPDFVLESDKDKEETQKVQKATRKLRAGEILMVREWPRKEEKSGLMRMKCKVKSDGNVGWVTTVGNQGNVYVEVQ